MCLPVAILCDMVPRWFYARELYSTDGTPTPLSVSYDTPLLFPELHPVVAVALHSCLLLALVTMMIGWRTRISVAFAFVVYTSFCLLDSVSTLTKYTVIASSRAAAAEPVASAGPSGRSTVCWRDDSNARAGWIDDAMLAARRSPVWPTRLIQLLDRHRLLRRRVHENSHAGILQRRPDVPLADDRLQLRPSARPLDVDVSLGFGRVVVPHDYLGNSVCVPVVEGNWDASSASQWASGST